MSPEPRELEEAGEGEEEDEEEGGGFKKAASSSGGGEEEPEFLSEDLGDDGDKDLITGAHSILDVDGDGELTIAELKSFVREIERADKDGDGKVDVDEFYSALRSHLDTKAGGDDGEVGEYGPLWFVPHGLAFWRGNGDLLGQSSSGGESGGVFRNAGEANAAAAAASAASAAGNSAPPPPPPPPPQKSWVERWAPGLCVERPCMVFSVVVWSVGFTAFYANWTFCKKDWDDGDEWCREPSWSKGFYYTVQAGLSIGFGVLTEASVLSIWVSTLNVLLGALLAAYVLAAFTESLVRGID